MSQATSRYMDGSTASASVWPLQRVLDWSVTTCFADDAALTVGHPTLPSQAAS